MDFTPRAVTMMGWIPFMSSTASATDAALSRKYWPHSPACTPGLAESLGQSTTNPLDASKVLLDPNNQVEDLGLEDFRGEQVRHYRVAVSTQAALDANPSMRDQMDATGAELPDTVEYDVFVNEASQLRRMYFELDMLGQTVSVEMVFTALDTIDPIVIPSADQVTDVTEMLADAMGG